MPFPSDEILSGYEGLVSSGKDQLTTWVKTDPDVTLERHMVDVQKDVEEFRQASARRHDASFQAYRFDNKVPNRLLVQKTTERPRLESRTSTWKRKMFFENESQARGTSSEVIEYIDHDILTNRFHVTH